MKLREDWDSIAKAWEARTVTLVPQDDPYTRIAMNALPLTDEWRVLDVGCGTGKTTVALAGRAGPNARVTGVDISPQMILYAKRRNHATIMRGELTPGNVDFLVADAEVDDLGHGYDAVFSRFGTMFFDDPDAGFTNLASTLKPAGWLSMAVWAEPEGNPWMPLPTEAAAKVLDASVPPADPDGPGPFSLADRDATVALLERTGFHQVNVLDITQPRRIRRDTEMIWATTAVQIGPLGPAFEAADGPEQRAVVAAVVEALERYRTGGPTSDIELPAHARVFVARRA